MTNSDNVKILYISDPATTDSKIESQLHVLGHSVDRLLLDKVDLSDVEINQYSLIMIEDPEFEDIQRIIDTNTKQLKHIPMFLVIDKGKEDLISKALQIGVDEFVIKYHDDLHLDLLELLIEKAISHRKTKTSKFKAERAFQESERQFETLVHSLQDGICIFDLDENFIFANEAADEIFGVESGALIGRNLLEFVNTMTASIIKNQTKLRKKGETGRYEIEIQRDNGEKRRIALTVSPKFDDTSKKISILGIFKDVTESVENNEKIFFQSLILDQIQDKVIATDLEGKITYVNNEVCEALGKSYEQLIGSNVRILGENPKRGASQTEIIRRTVANGAWRGEVVNYTENKEEIVLDTRTKLLTDHNGVAYGMIGISTDISEAKDIEKALKESEEKYRILAENQKDMVFTVRRDGFLEYVSPAVRQFGYEPDEEIGCHFSKYLAYESEIIEAGTKLEQQFRDHKPRVYELSYKTNYGKVIPIEVTGTPIVQNGECKSINCVLRDISQRKMAEEALKQSEERLTKAQEVAEIGSWEYNSETQQPRWSKQLFSIFGIDPEDGEPDFESHKKYIHPDDWDFFVDSVNNAVNNNVGYDIELRIMQPSGNMIWVNSKCEPKVENGKLVGLIGTTQNITYRKRAEENLKQVIAEAKALYDASRAIFDCKTFEESARKIFDACRASTGAISGYIALLNEKGDENEVLFIEDGGLPCIVDPNLPMPVRGLREIAYKEKKVAYENNFMKSEWVKLMPEGHVILNNVLFAPLVIDDVTVGVMGIANKPSHFTTNDVRMSKAFGDLAAIALERSRTLERLRARDERYQSFLNATNDYAYIKDASLRYILVNKSMTSFWNLIEDDMLGKTDFEIMPEEFAKLTEKSDKLALAENRMVLSTEVFAGKVFEARKFPIHLDSQTGVGGFIRDITEEKKKERDLAKLEEQFRQAQKMEAIGILAGGVAHDFNNILNVIIGYSEMLMESITENDPSFEKIENIRKNADRATVLTRQLLAFSRKQILQPSVLNLNTVIVNMKNMLWRLIGEDIQLLTDLDPLLSPIKADRGQIEQVIMNIAVNARDAMPDGGTLTIETKNVKLDNEYVIRHTDGSVDHHIMLTIADTGIGMPKEVREKCFEPFFTTKKQGKGTGLGISTAYGIVKQSGGSIWVDSEVGKGTTFIIYFPVDTSKPSERHIRISDATIRRKSITVLIVEDNEPMCDMIGEILRNSNFRVFQTSVPMDAIELYKEHRDEIDIVLTDVVMPGMSGRKLVDQLQEINNEIKVLFMSGYTDDAIVHKGVLDEGTEFIQKPFTGKELVKKIQSVYDMD